jgi:hypothetical protein
MAFDSGPVAHSVALAFERLRLRMLLATLNRTAALAHSILPCPPGNTIGTKSPLANTGYFSAPNSLLTVKGSPMSQRQLPSC